MLQEQFAQEARLKEKEFISLIKKTLNSKYIGDDCAHLKDLGITISQDSLVEGIHFNMEWMTPFELGYKSVMVNLSDIAASGAKAAYLTISLSLPANTENDFIEHFYDGCKSACPKGVEIVGGDITGSDKIYISICAIGKTEGRNISTRSGAQIGQKVIVSGVHGSSRAGLELLSENRKNSKFINAHLAPKVQIKFGEQISTGVKGRYAMMDTSDGLMDALGAIAKESKVRLDIDFNKIPYDKDIEQFDFWQDMVLFGGEDYQIVATVPQDFDYGIKIGDVKQGSGVYLNYDNRIIHYTQKDIETKLYNHFGETK